MRRRGPDAAAPRSAVTAFGPFAGTETVDFDALVDGRLFLLHRADRRGQDHRARRGRFALYGQVPGARRSAPAGLPAQRPRRRRASPRWSPSRPPSAADDCASPAPPHGSARSAAATARRPSRPGARRGARRRAAGPPAPAGSTRPATSCDLLGMTLAQFCQVVLLPRASSPRSCAPCRPAACPLERSSTPPVHRRRALAGARRQVTARDLGEFDDRLRQLLARVAEASGEEPPERPHRAAGRHRGRAMARRPVGAVARHRAGAGEAAGATAAAAEAAAQRWPTLSASWVSAVVRRRSSSGRLRWWPPGRPGTPRWPSCRMPCTVAPLLPVLAEAGRLQTELEDARAQAYAAHGRLVTVLAATGTTGRSAPSAASSTAANFSAAVALPALAVVRTASRATAEEAATLALLAEQEAEADELTRQADELQRRPSSSAPSRRRPRSGWPGPPSAAAFWRQRATRPAWPRRRFPRSSRTVTRPPPDWRRRCAVTPSVTSWSSPWTSGGAWSIGTRRRATVCSRWRPTARRHGRRARRRPAAGRRLPGLGNPEHPRPARPGDSAAAAEDEEAAEAACCRPTPPATRVSRSSPGSMSSWPRCAPRPGAIAVADPDPARQRRPAAGRHRRRRGRVDAAQAEFVSFGQEAERRERDRVADESEQRSAAARAVDSRSRADRLTAELAAARGDDPSISARRERLQRTARDLDGLVGHLSDIDRLEAAVVGALDRVEAAIQERGLRSVEEVLAAVRDADRLSELEELTRRHDSDVAAVTEQLADP